MVERLFCWHPSFHTSKKTDTQSVLKEWAEVDSNHRSKLQQIYSLSPLATRESIHIHFSMNKADDRTRTDNLLITNQLLCQLSHIGL